jgi:peptidoglycan/LPS O-acetylase OafA/YrhL
MGSSSGEATFSLHRSARLDGLRAFAALAVLFIHSSIVANNTWVTPLFGAGFIGVHLFFLISGYVINLAWDAQGDKSASTFYIRRVFRVAPLYYVMLALTYIMW